MLSADLLRTNTSRGKIMPLFCTTDFGSGSDYELANKLITHFTNAQKNNQTKGELLGKITLLESEYDYKLVRGLSTLLERRSVFEVASSSSIASPITVRQKLFEESSKQNLALSDSQRENIVQKIADQMHVSSEEIETIMWSDKENNLVLNQFDVINPKDLILWYNISLTQTLLFKCTGLEFYVKGGLYWKQVLRNVKRHGLMYSLEYNTDDNDSIKCVLEGPLSLFKMTDRYGTSMAKLLPSIIGTPTWKIKGSIVRKNDDGQKIYQFELSSEDTKKFLRSTIDAVYQNNGRGSIENEGGYVYDSSVEATFAKRFYQHFDQNDKFGWKISREPDPLIADGKAMIPDFLFERFGRKVYFEIVGFWTKEYLDRKAAKLRDLFENNNNKNIDLLVAVNSELSCSQIETISKDRIFTFKKDVSIKPILEHLKKIDAEITKEKIDNTQIKIDVEDMNLISIKQVAYDNAIPEEAALKILDAKHHDKYITVGSYLISKEKAKSVNESLDGISKFVQACKDMTSHKIPDICHADLLSKLGYDVVWNDLDPNNAAIIKKGDCKPVATNCF